MRRATMMRKTAKPFLSLAVGREWESLAPRGAVMKLATAMPRKAVRFTKPRQPAGRPGVFQPPTI